jgi:ParB-like chromosome segregation protein Spo0J
MATATAKTHNVVPDLRPLLQPIDSVQPHPDNARVGDVDFIREIARDHGQYQPVIAQKSSGLIVVGRHRWQAFLEEGWTHCAIVLQDIDDDAARELRLKDNRASDRAGYDEKKLYAELQAVVASRTRDADEQELASAEQLALAGIGFDAGELVALAKIAAGPEPAEPPAAFSDPEAGMETDFCCPQCGYEWSGQAKPPGS